MQKELGMISMNENETIEIELQFGKLRKKCRVGDLVNIKNDRANKVYKIIELKEESNKFVLKHRDEQPLQKLFEDKDLEQFNKKFYSGINVISYSRVIKELNKMIFPNKPQITRTQDEISGSIRKTINLENNEVSFLKKERIWDSLMKKRGSNQGDILANEFGCKINISKEIKLSDTGKLWNPDLQRIKTRNSYYFKGGFRIDITQIDTTEFNKKVSKNTTYELEIEMDKDSLNDSKKFYGFFIHLLKIYQGSEIAYTLSEKDDMYSNVMKLMGIERDKLKREDLTEARDLKSEDLVFGGIVGNKTTPYDVTIKTDGKRKLMAILSNGIWLIMPGTEEVDHVSTVAPKEYMNTILDGELVSKDDIRGSQLKYNNFDDTDKYKYRYFIFDCISYCGDLNTKNIKNHFERLTLGKEVARGTNYLLEAESNRINSKLISIQLINKTFYKILSVEEFYVVMYQLFAKRNNEPYKDDGFIFTPMATGYYCNPLSKNMINPKDRNATLMNDIIKWKPINLRTIDLSLRWVMSSEGKFLTLDTYIDKDGQKEYVSFKGNSSYPFLPNSIDTENILFKNYPLDTGLVYEFYWDSNKSKLVPLKFREDKPLPNRSDVAQSVWTSIFNGVTDDTLKGKSFDLMRLYHNKIKRNLLESCGEAKYLLDIGSGKGGDLKKWNNFEIVIAVEPNEEHIKEFENRLHTLNPNTKVFIVKGGGQDYDLIEKEVKQRIPGGKVDVLSIMLSLSFFDTREKRSDLYKTITNNLKIGGDVLIVTIDGDSVRQLFDPLLSQPSIDINIDGNKRSLNIINSKLEYETDTNYLTIDIPNTIVKNQRERPPFFSEILYEAPYLYLFSIHRANQESFMNFSEKILSNLYTFAKLKMLDNTVQDIEIETEYDLGEGLKAISLIPDNYTVLHGILKYFNEDYQNDNTLINRLTLVKNFYEELKEITTNDAFRIKPINDEAIEIISKILKIRIMKNNKIFGEEGPSIVIYNNYLIINDYLKNNDLEEIKEKYENTCTTYLQPNTFSSLLNKVIKNLDINENILKEKK